MKLSKWNSFVIAVAGFALITCIGAVLIDAADRIHEQPAADSARLFKFKTSDPNGMNVATQMLFRPSKQSKMKISLQSGDKTNCIEFTVKSELNSEGARHEVQVVFYEQTGSGKPIVVRRPNLRTVEGIPAEVQMNDFHFDVQIEPVTQKAEFKHNHK